MSKLAFPYPTLFPCIRSQCSWEATIDGNDRKFSDGSRSWDYDSQVEIVCRLPWQPAVLFEQAGLSPLLEGTRLAVVISTGTSEGTGRRFVVIDRPILECPSDDDGTGVTLSAAVDSTCLCNRIKATLFIYSTGGQISGIRLLSGSVLYKEEASLQLEGELGSFPIRSLGFSSHNLGDGLWLVDCRAESPEDPLISSVTLLLNSDRTEFIDQLQRENRPNDFLRWTIRADVMASALTWLLLSSELSFDNTIDWPEGSLGAVASKWLQTLGFESQSSLLRLGEEMRREPGRFRQRCQAACTISLEES